MYYVMTSFYINIVHTVINVLCYDKFLHQYCDEC